MRPLLVEHHQLLGILHRQLAQQHLVDQREDRGVGADAERERQDRDDGEERAAEQPAQGQPEVVDGLSHGGLDGSPAGGWEAGEFAVRSSQFRVEEPTVNLFAPSNVTITGGGAVMSFLKRLLGQSEPPKQRIQVCVECGMPVKEHKNWCSILRGQDEMKRKAAETESA